MTSLSHNKLIRTGTFQQAGLPSGDTSPASYATMHPFLVVRYRY